LWLDHSGKVPHLEIIKAKRAGFCFGVKRAIDIAFNTARKEKSGIFTLGPIIHNPQVIGKLKEEGIVPIDIDDIGKKDVKVLIIRTHGIPVQVYDSISSRDFKVIDATCPFVKKAQRYAKHLAKKGFQVVILGNRDHPEVMGLVSFAGEDVLVVDEETALHGCKSKVGIVVQTTQPIEALKKVLSRVVEQAREVKVYNTICNSTALRLKETGDMARRANVMVVVGGKNSANTTQLANLCRSLKVKTFHIETAGEIEDGWFTGSKKVGITAGASTPDWLISEVEKRIRDIGGKPRNGH
jgi:4-hydroxy-3-methylbut-2-en-1-yl diphosphate reductase